MIFLGAKQNVWTVKWIDSFTDSELFTCDFCVEKREIYLHFLLFHDRGTLRVVGTVSKKPRSYLFHARNIIPAVGLALKAASASADMAFT